MAKRAGYLSQRGWTAFGQQRNQRKGHSRAMLSVPCYLTERASALHAPDLGLMCLTFTEALGASDHLDRAAPWDVSGALPALQPRAAGARLERFI
jgi:hypothetical protein